MQLGRIECSMALDIYDNPHLIIPYLLRYELGDYKAKF